MFGLMDTIAGISELNLTDGLTGATRNKSEEKYGVMVTGDLFEGVGSMFRVIGTSLQDFRHSICINVYIIG